MVE
ncbi:Epimerase family protein, partial [Haemophilus influenzae]|jgi:hypothetical protein